MRIWTWISSPASKMPTLKDPFRTPPTLFLFYIHLGVLFAYGTALDLFYWQVCYIIFSFRLGIGLFSQDFMRLHTFKKRGQNGNICLFTGDCGQQITRSGGGGAGAHFQHGSAHHASYVSSPPPPSTPFL
jgi:hypothetical protein